MPPSITKILLGVIAIFLFGCTQTTKEKSSMEDPTDVVASEKTEDQYSIGQVAPDFSLPDLQNKNTNLSDLKDNFVVVHFATTWCPFCNAEAPYLEKLHKEYKSLGVNVIIIDVRESAELVKEKLQDKFDFTFPVLLDRDGVVAASYCPPDIQPDLPRDEVMIASNLIIDTEGKIQFFSLLDSKGFDAKLTELKNKLDELLAAS